MQPSFDYTVTDKPCSHPLITLLRTSHVAILSLHCSGQAMQPTFWLHCYGQAMQPCFGFIVTDKLWTHPLATLLRTSYVPTLWLHCYGQAMYPPFGYTVTDKLCSHPFGYTVTDKLCNHPFATLYLQVVLPLLARRQFHDFTDCSFTGSSSTISRTTFSRFCRFCICRQLYNLQQGNIFTILLLFYLQVVLPPLAGQHIYDFIAFLFAGSSSTFSKTTFSRFYMFYWEIALPPLVRQHFHDFVAC